MGQLAESITHDLLAGMAAGLEDAGTEIVADIRQAISVPVEDSNPARARRTGWASHFDRQFVRRRPKQLGTGRRFDEGDGLIRSRRGEPPRRETGALWEDCQLEVSTDADADTATLAVFFTLFYAATLQLKLDRPITDPAFDAWAPRMPDVMTQNFR